MFEDSLVESRIHQLSPTRRWTTVASMALQFSLAAAVIALPLLHPEALPLHLETPRALLPLPPKPPAPVVHSEHTSSTLSGVAIPSTPTRPLLIPSLLPGRNIATNDPPPLASIGSGMGTPDGLPTGIGTGTGTPVPIVSIASPKPATGPLHISRGVSEGMLLSPIRPIYPAIAKAAGIQGTIVIEAVISKAGTVESLHVVSGPAMLQSAAIEAIRAARYQPYRLNGEPTEIQTTFTVNFLIGG